MYKSPPPIEKTIPTPKNQMPTPIAALNAIKNKLIITVFCFGVVNLNSGGRKIEKDTSPTDTVVVIIGPFILQH